MSDVDDPTLSAQEVDIPAAGAVSTKARKGKQEKAETSDHDSELFRRHRIFPDAKPIFSHSIPAIIEVKDTCLVLLDNSVLLAPYQGLEKKGIDDVHNTYRKLIDKQQLLVPGHAAREFASLRPKLIAELIEKLDGLSGKLVPPDDVSAPLLKNADGYSEFCQSSDDLRNQLKTTRKTLEKVIASVRSWAWNDPVSLMYHDLFTESLVIDVPIIEDELKADLTRRKEQLIPPGYKDGGHLGDLVIWRTILEIGSQQKRPLMLVTNERKADWWHRSNKHVMFARFELVEEYRKASEGQPFYLVSFADFLELYGATPETVKQVQQSEGTVSGNLRDQEFHSPSRAYGVHTALLKLSSDLLDWKRRIRVMLKDNNAFAVKKLCLQIEAVFYRSPFRRDKDILDKLLPFRIELVGLRNQLREEDELIDGAVANAFLDFLNRFQQDVDAMSLQQF